MCGKKATLDSLAIGELHRKGMRDTITESDIEKELAKFSDEEKQTYLEAYAEEYIQEHIRQVIEDNCRRIQDEIQGIMDSHGIGTATEESAAPGPEPAAKPAPAVVPSEPAEEAEPEDYEDGISDEEPPEEYWTGEEEYVE